MTYLLATKKPPYFCVVLHYATKLLTMQFFALLNKIVNDAIYWHYATKLLTMQFVCIMQQIAKRRERMPKMWILFLKCGSTTLRYLE